MNVTGYDLPLVNHPDVPQLAIHPHQAAMVDEWNTRDSFLLVTKTGSGKTAASVLPVALNRQKMGDNCAVFVYPTKALIEDQERSILELLQQKLKLSVNRITPDNHQHPPADIDLVRLDADILADFCKAWGIKRKADALERLLNAPRARFVLINPDILYLLYNFKYGRRAGNVVAALQAYQTIVFDEFHLYNGVELANILYLIHAGRAFGAFKRVVLLSATPHPQVRAWVDKLLHNPREITMLEPVAHPPVQARRVAHDVTLKVVHKGRDVVKAAAEQAHALLPELQRLRALTHNNGKTSYVPLVIILNSVVHAIELEDQLRAMGVVPEAIVPIRGMSHRGIRAVRAEQLIVVGTSAIEVGIDFQCDYLIFEAGDAASFMQRFGRLGRHQPGVAFLLGSQRECQALEAFGSTINRSGLEEAVIHTYPEADARAWFVGTELGAFAALAQAFNVRNAVFEDRDRLLDTDDAKQDIYNYLQQTMAEYGSIMGIAPNVKAAQRLFWNWARKRSQAWVGDYLNITTFRTSLPNVTVHDRSEERRRGVQFARYEMQVSDLFKRAINPDLRNGIVFIEGLGSRDRVGINWSFLSESEKESCLLTTADYPTLMLTKNLVLHAGSHLMSRTEQKHVFVFVPYEEVRDQLDWRLETFPCGSYHPAKYILAFDGDALLLKEIYNRAKAIQQQAVSYEQR